MRGPGGGDARRGKGQTTRDPVHSQQDLSFYPRCNYEPKHETRQDRERDNFAYRKMILVFR